MDNETALALLRDGTGTGTSNTDGQASGGLDIGVAEWARTALEGSSGVRVGSMSRTEVDETLGLLGQVLSVATSLMCDVGRQVADSEPYTEPAEILRQCARLPSRESKKIAKVAEQLSEMPKVRERQAASLRSGITCRVLVSACSAREGRWHGGVAGSF